MPDPQPQHTDTTASHGCEHCDGSVPHKHLDVAEAVSAEEQRLRSGMRITALSAALAALAGIVVAVLALPAPASWLWVLAAALIGLAGWGISTGLGLVVAGGAAQPGQRAAQRLLVAALIPAALTPITGFAATLLGFTHAPLLACAAASGWLIGAAGAHILGHQQLAQTLRQEGQLGEVTRQAAVHGDLGKARFGWLLHPAGVALWGALAALMPIALIVLVPLHVTLTLGLAARRSRLSR